MTCGFIIAEINRHTKRLQRIFIAALDLLKSRLQLTSVFREHVLEVLAVIVDLQLEMTLLQGPFKTCEHGTFKKGFAEVITALDRIAFTPTSTSSTPVVTKNAPCAFLYAQCLPSSAR